MLKAKDPEVQLFVQCSDALQEDYPAKKTIWKGSPFEWIQRKPSSTKGAIGKKLISNYLTRKGFDVYHSPGSEADRVIADKRVAIKTSCLWKSGKYRFQQIRDQDYDFVMCLGISPSDVHCWVFPKQLMIEKWDSGEISSQHLGEKGRETSWFPINPRALPEWIAEQGGSLTEAVNKIIEITKQKPLP